MLIWQLALLEDPSMVFTQNNKKLLKNLYTIPAIVKRVKIITRGEKT